ncbi:hypothetical protein [Lentilactobacillus kosonis]|uniref:Phage terminase, large subunit n=1 Tax=Lentilactobacillus kosonis TaxID=2810561 RepID=A0A401FPM6_9LACO|nr:hypothetical protein [Lentilactobacillus kosonis]GAY74340.1 phage terminase, large subunit [Lentilactobacillus kosonis]
MYVGFDASQYSDDTSLAFVFPYEQDGRQMYHIYQHSFIPTSRTQQSINIKENQDGIPYREEEKRGLRRFRTQWVVTLIILTCTTGC